MGRIKTDLIKRITHKIMEKHGYKITDNFEKNKQIVGMLVDFPSKKIRNVVAGYATRLVKMRNRPRVRRIVQSEEM
ncbi:MAG: 30S ribosomal protein S17e [Candidatus Woesearchaeota archaeon]